ncbi:MAG: aldo/keto reductase [Xanthomonadales bacterium]|nr:aldo/keto reductase [Xanthomonadales bacterium]
MPSPSLTLPRLAFGTASIHHLPDARARAALLDLAVELGLTHFDTAPLYGFGFAERELAALLRRHPGRISIATKVGLYPPGGSDQSAWQMWARKLGGRVWPALSRFHSDFDLARAEASLGGSLRRLGCERVDLLLLHEPTLAALDPEAWLRWLQREQARGRIGHYGMSGPADALQPLAARLPGTVLQVEDRPGSPASALLSAAGLPPQLLFGYLSAAARSGGPVDGVQILADALRRSPQASVLFSSRQPARLRATVEALRAEGALA